jgi:hypothetical protein
MCVFMCVVNGHREDDVLPYVHARHGMTELDLVRLRELAAALGFWPATTVTSSGTASKKERGLLPGPWS